MQTQVYSTTRRADREATLKENGAHHVIVDNGKIAEKVMALGGVDKVLELIGTTSLEDSLQCCREGGAVCMTGSQYSPTSSLPVDRDHTLIEAV